MRQPLRLPRSSEEGVLVVDEDASVAARDGGIEDGDVAVVTPTDERLARR